MAILAAVSATELNAEEINGTVRTATAEYATATTESDLMPIPGDKAEIFFKLPGADTEISVASGHVYEITGANIMVKIDKATGSVAKDQLVRINSPNAKKRPEPERPSSPQLPASAPASSSSGAGYIGVQFALNPTDTNGVLVTAVKSEGPAAKAGIKPNDLVVAVDGAPVENTRQLAEMTARLSPGTRHALLILREGKPQKFEVLVAERPANVPSAESNVVPQETPPSAPAEVPAANPSPTSAPGEGAADSLAAPYINKGIAEYSAGHIDAAIAAYTEGIRVASSIAALYLNRSLAYLQKSNYDAAFDDVNKALELKTTTPADAYVVRSTARAGKGDLKGAIADCNHALKLNPQHALAYNNRANDKLRLRQFDSALADCNKSIELNSASPLPYYNRGYAYMNKGLAKKAIADWTKAIQMQPSYRAELEPLMQRLGGSAQAKQGTTSAPQMSDLVNPAQKIVGTWQGARHRKQYFSDGTFVTDPHLVPNPPRTQWRVEGDRLSEYYPGAGTNITVRILSISNRELVTTDDQGHTFRAKRIPEAQARKERANW